MCIGICAVGASFANDRDRITLVHQQLRCVRIICKCFADRPHERRAAELLQVAPAVPRRACRHRPAQRRKNPVVSALAALAAAIFASAVALRAQHLQTTGRTQHFCISNRVACAAFANDRANATLVHQHLRCGRIICKRQGGRTVALPPLRAQGSICKRQSAHNTCA